MNRVAFLTGSSSGIGKAVTGLLTKNGWRVIAPTHKELDLADIKKVAEFATNNTLPFKSVDAFVHIAGIWHDDHTAWADTPFADFSPEQIVKTMNVGLTSFMLLTKHLLTQGQLGHVVGVSGTFEDSGAVGWLPYYTSKRALEDFLVGLAQDYPKLKVYGVSPSDTATAVYKRFYPQYAKSAQRPEAVAGAIVSLLEQQTGFKSGDIIVVRDGEQKLGFHA